MNKKCFCCFESRNNNFDSENDLMTDWLDFRSEELEANLSNKDKRHLLKFDVFANRILDATLDSKKYYRTGFGDRFKLLSNSLIK